uniref:Uncharacterized protein n=1 Tax=Anopheles culicifacies TaxID=139723 RepID=A0A182MPM6_9DIPT
MPLAMEIPRASYPPRKLSKLRSCSWAAANGSIYLMDYAVALAVLHDDASMDDDDDDDSVVTLSNRARSDGPSRAPPEKEKTPVLRPRQPIAALVLVAAYFLIYLTARSTDRNELLWFGSSVCTWQMERLVRR